MKKILFSVLFIILGTILLAGCNNSKKNNDGGNGNTSTPISPNDLNTLKGNYQVDGVYSTVINKSSSNNFSYTNNCSLMSKFVSDAQCSDTDNINLDNQAIISGSDAKNMALEVKLQIWGGNFNNTDSNFASFIKTNAFNYIKFGAVRDLTGEMSKSKGLQWINMGADYLYDNDTIFYVTLESDGRILVHANIKYSNDYSASTYILLGKVSDSPSVLDPSTLVAPNADGFDKSGFVQGIGTYEVSFFGSQVTNVRDNTTGTPTEDPSLIELYYISNDCSQAIQLYPNVINMASPKPSYMFDHINNCNNDAIQSNTQSTLLKGLVTVKIENNNVVVTSKMEMKKGAVDASSTDKYQYTEYNGVPFTGILPISSITGQGVKAWNYNTEKKSPSYGPFYSSTSPFNITLNGDNIDIQMTLKDKIVLDQYKIDAVTRVIGKKVGLYKPLDNSVDVNLDPDSKPDLD